LVGEAAAGGETLVTTGFIGKTPAGEITTLGRGGSDFSAALFGERLAAEEIQIWTDVDGVMTADPRVVPAARLLDTLSFEEASELAYYGAKVLHPATIVPAIKKNIPVRVLNTMRPEIRGTTIVRAGVKAPTVAKSIATKKNIHVINITSLRMLLAHGFLARIFEIFDRYQVVIDMVATSEVSVSVTTDSERNLEPALAEIRGFAEVEHRSGRTILYLVGHGLRETAGIASVFFQTLADAGVNIEMISQGSTRINIGIIIQDGDAARAVQTLHRRFFERA
ncbi:MAG: aspartate kinase, partial [Planctomycetes bacterium]|nr:aspartate kinase [Planctomycetota bacterium]